MINRIIIFLLLTGTQIYPQLPLPTGTSPLFSGSGNCLNCHISNGNSVLFFNGEDLTPATHWRSSMMANSSKDPLWRAVVSEEITKFPSLSNEIQSTCTRCHAPMGYTQAIQNGNQYYTLDQVKSDPLANDGVSCALCHQVQTSNMGADSSYSGHYIITAARKIFGPYQTPLAAPMQNSVNYTPEFSGHMDQSEFCGTCHTLFTPYLDDQNNIAGMFPEQTPYIEWKNSSYRENNINCQSCHMPKIESPIDISTTPPWHSVGRTPFWRHTFAGGNIFLGTMLKANVAPLQLTASPQNFDSTIKRSRGMLNSAIELDLIVSSAADTIIAKVRIKNLSGHKLPSGIPYRRMWLYLTVKDDSGNPVFESGKWDSTGKIINGDDYQPHYREITGSHQAQVYESVLKDVNDSITYTLLRAAGYKKDNRIPPAGFSSTHTSYDTIKIVGEAENDPDFNIEELTEGSGADWIIYKVPVSQPGHFTVSAGAVYQSVPPALAEHLSEFNTPDIQSFLTMYNSAERSPVILGTISGEATITDIQSEKANTATELRSAVYPNPADDKITFKFTIPSPSEANITVYNIIGEKMAEPVSGFFNEGTHEIAFGLTREGVKFPPGVYLYRLNSGNLAVTNKIIISK